MPDRLLIYQALWAMTGLSAAEAPLAEKFDRIRDAGFDGMAIDLGALTLKEAEALLLKAWAREAWDGAPDSCEG